MNEKLHMASVGRPGNRAVHHALIAIARAHLLMDGASLARANTIAERIDRAVADEKTMNVTIALSMLLLRATGAADAFDESRVRPH